MSVSAKICGIRSEEALKASLLGGAAFIGFVLYPPSKNFITAEDASHLAGLIPPHITKTGLFVDVSDDELQATLKKVPLDLLQLHGMETPDRVAAIATLTGKPVMKALRLLDADHLKAISLYEPVADRLLFDSRIGPEPSGGPISWSLLKDRTFKKPWMLAGGLNAQNVKEAVGATGATAVDVSSGVEDPPGQKSPTKITEFLAVVKML